MQGAVAFAPDVRARLVSMPLPSAIFKVHAHGEGIKHDTHSVDAAEFIPCSEVAQNPPCQFFWSMSRLEESIDAK